MHAPMRRLLPLACLAGMAAVTCGGRTQLGVPRRDGGTIGCVPARPPVAHCTAWVAGTPLTIAPPPPSNGGLQLGGAAAVTCGALVAWYTVTPEPSGALTWSTRLVGFDGAPLAQAVTHPALGSATDTSAAISLAVGGARVGALVSDAVGCKFGTLDMEGHDTAGALPLGTGRCFGLAARGSGWSFLRAAGTDSTPPLQLAELDSAGHELDETLAAAVDQTAWERLTFGDGSFLLDTFREDLSTSTDTNWLTPYDAAGDALGPRVAVDGFDSAPVWLVAAGQSALAFWSWDALYARPVGREGVATGASKNVSGKATIYELRAAALPDGDVLMVWKALEAASRFGLYAVSLAPDGTPRGTPTRVAGQLESSFVEISVEPTGARAVLISDEVGGLQALPITCAP